MRELIYEVYSTRNQNRFSCGESNLYYKIALFYYIIPTIPATYYSLFFRSCNVVEDDPTFLYHFCDAKPGSSGSGVYSWVYDNNLQDWKQELVGVFSGNRWRRYDYFFIVSRNFNVAVRLTSTKYAQICRWMGKTAKEVCKYKYDKIDKE